MNILLKQRSVEKVALILFLLFSITEIQAQSLTQFFDQSDQVFKNHVKNGRVDYNSLKENPQLLNNLVKQVGTINPKEASKIEQKAFYINAYNLLVINQVVQNYPISSPMDVGGFFDANKFTVAGNKLTLNQLENDVLRKDFADPRLHFVLVCGAVSCPTIPNLAFKPASLEKQLSERTKKAINDPSFIYQKDGKLWVSEIFKWYADDFEDPAVFINDYSMDHFDLPLTYYTYDWKLNDIETLINPVSSEETESSAGGQTYNPGTLLKKGQVDLTMFNSIYTENKSNWDGQDFSGFRNTFGNILLQFTYGTSQNARINAGIDFSLRNNGSSGDSTYSGIGEGLAFENSITSRVGLASIAPKIKISPFKNNNDITIQSQFLIVLPGSAEGSSDRYWMEWDRNIWWTQFFYSKLFAQDKFQLFAEADLLFRFKRKENQGNHVDVPASIFLSYFPNRKMTFYIMSQHTQRFSTNTPSDWVLNANFSTSGIGFKYQLTPQLQTELLYTNFWRAKNNGLGETFNLGIKYIR